MAKLTDEQLLVLDNLIYLREIANDNENIDSVKNFIESVTDESDGKRVLKKERIYEAEKAAKISTLKAAGQFETADEVENMTQDEFMDKYVKDVGMESYQKAVDMVIKDEQLMNLNIKYTSGKHKEKRLKQNR